MILTVRPQYYPHGMPLDHDLAEEFDSQCNPQTVKTKMLFGVEQLTTSLHSHNKRARITEPKTVSKYSQSLKKKRWQALKDFITISLMIPDKQNRWLFHGVKVAKKIIKKCDIDLVYAHGGPWSAIVIGALVKKMTGIPLVIDFRDPWVDNPYDDLTSSLRTSVNNFMERWCVSSANFVIANTDAMNDLFVAKYERSSVYKFITITNGYDEDDYTRISSLERPSTDTPVTIVHTGTLYSKRSPLPFLTVIAELIRAGEISENDIKISLVGKVNIPQIEIFLAEKGLEKIVDLPGQMSRQQALDQVFSADILLLLQQGTKLQVPGKLFEYIRSGKPIFTICNEGATKDIILNNKLGVVADAENVGEVRKRFVDFFKDIKATKRSGGKQLFAPAQETITSFSSTVQSEKLATIFNKALSE